MAWKIWGFPSYRAWGFFRDMAIGFLFLGMAGSLLLAQGAQSNGGNSSSAPSANPTPSGAGSSPQDPSARLNTPGKPSSEDAIRKQLEALQTILKQLKEQQQTSSSTNAPPSASIEETQVRAAQKLMQGGRAFERHFQTASPSAESPPQNPAAATETPSNFIVPITNPSGPAKNFPGISQPAGPENNASAPTPKNPAFAGRNGISVPPAGGGSSTAGITQRQAGIQAFPALKKLSSSPDQEFKELITPGLLGKNTLSCLNRWLNSHEGIPYSCEVNSAFDSEKKLTQALSDGIAYILDYKRQFFPTSIYFYCGHSPRGIDHTNGGYDMLRGSTWGDRAQEVRQLNRECVPGNLDQQLINFKTSVLPCQNDPVCFDQSLIGFLTYYYLCPSLWGGLGLCTSCPSQVCKAILSLKSMLDRILQAGEGRGTMPTPQEISNAVAQARQAIQQTDETLNKNHLQLEKIKKFYERLQQIAGSGGAYASLSEEERKKVYEKSMAEYQTLLEKIPAPDRGPFANLPAFQTNQAHQASLAPLSSLSDGKNFIANLLDPSSVIGMLQPILSSMEQDRLTFFGNLLGEINSFPLDDHTTGQLTKDETCYTLYQKDPELFKTLGINVQGVSDKDKRITGVTIVPGLAQGLPANFADTFKTLQASIDEIRTELGFTKQEQAVRDQLKQWTLQNLLSLFTQSSLFSCLDKVA